MNSFHQSPIAAISRRGLERRVQEGEEEERGREEEEEEERERSEEEEKMGALERIKRFLRVDSDETDDLHNKYRW